MKTSAAAFGRLCVETVKPALAHGLGWQPPSGGCVLKPGDIIKVADTHYAAAFGRLCVETGIA